MNKDKKQSSPLSRIAMAALTTGVGAAIFHKTGGNELLSEFAPRINKTLSSMVDDLHGKTLKDFDYEGIRKFIGRGITNEDSVWKKEAYDEARKISLRTTGDNAVAALVKMEELKANHMDILRKNFNDEFSENLIKHLDNKFQINKSKQFDGIKDLVRHVVKKNDLISLEEGQDVVKLNTEMINSFIDLDDLGIKGESKDFFDEVLGAVRDTKEENWSNYKDKNLTKDKSSNKFVDSILSKFNVDTLGKKFGTGNSQTLIDEFKGTKALTFNDYIKNADKFEEQFLSVGDKDISIKDMIKDAVVNNAELGDIILDSDNLKFSSNNIIIDNSELNEMKSNYGRKFAGTLPGKLMKITDRMAVKEPGILNYFDKGTSSPLIAGLSGQKDNILENNYMKILDDFYSVSKEGYLKKESFGDDLYTMSSKHGTMPRLMDKMFGEGAEREATNRWTKMFDINTSNEANIIDDLVRNKGFIGRRARNVFGGSQYNIIDNALNADLAEQDPLKYRESLQNLNYVMASITKTPRVDTINKLKSVVSSDSSKEILDAISGDDIDDMLRVLNKNEKSIKNRDLLKLIKTGSKDREAASKILSITSTELTPQKNINTYKDMIRREAFKDSIFNEIFNEKTGTKNHNAMLVKLRQAEITGTEYTNAKHLSNWMTLQFEGKLFNDDSIIKNRKTIEEANKTALNLMNLQRKEDSLPLNAEFVKEFTSSIDKIKNDYKSITTRTIDRKRPGKEVRAAEKNSYIVMRKAYNGKQFASDMIKDINDLEKIKANAKRFGSQFIAGKSIPNDITTYSMLPYFFSERLVDPFNKIGLGLSSSNMTSSAQMWKAIMLKRVLPTAVGLSALSYLNDTSKQITGTSFTGAAAQGIGNVDLGLRKIGDITHISSLLGGERAVDPITQYWFGNDYQDSNERKDYYTNGYDEVRKGRWWAFGSAGEFRGGKISFFEPNFVKRANSNYHDIALYGSLNEKWSHSWLPTPTHPFAPIRKLLDPYWLERKHYWDRPYMETAPLFAQGTPWGAILNPTVGQIIKPIKRMHKDETGKHLTDPRTLIAQQNAYTKAKAVDKNHENIFTIGPNGIQNVKYIASGLASPGSAIMSFKVGNGKVISASNNGVGYAQSLRDASSVSVASMNQINNAVSNSSGAGESVGISTPINSKKPKDNILTKIGSIVKGTRTGMALQGAYDTVTNSQGDYASAIISNANNAIKAKASDGVVIKENNLASMPARLASQRAITSQDESDLLSSSSNHDFIEDTIFSGKQLSGIYGFLGDMAFGNNERKVRRASADKMTSWTNLFWSANMGGAGGGPMEIARRFFPHSDHSWIDLNPIENTMPSWMPERFRTGDPYTKVTKGEMRLPGAGYETLHHLRSDEYGKYGALDRMRILGDIAPWSDEYKLWRGIAQKEVTDPEGKKEVQAIKDRVTEQSKQHDFFEYKFLGQNTTMNKVTIKSMKDDSITDMDGNTYSLAGIKMNKGASLENKLKAGMTVNVETLKNQANSPVKQAAIFSDGENINKALINEGQATKQKGDNLGAMGAIATTGSISQIYGTITEAIAHAPIPFVHSKVLRVDSAIESYKNEKLYGTSYSTWNHPIKGFIEPAFHKAWGRGAGGQGLAIAGWAAAEYSYANSSKIQKYLKDIGIEYSETAIKRTGSVMMNVLNPGAFSGSMMAAIPTGLMGEAGGIKGLLSTSVFGAGVEEGIGRNAARLGATVMLAGYGLTRTTNPIKSTAIFSAAGVALSKQLKHERFGEKEGVIAGAVVGLALSALRNPNFSKNMLHEYVPKDTKKRWDIDEYFDRLEYIKWQGLYNKAAKKAKFWEHVDIKKIISANDYARKVNQKKLDKLNKRLQDVSNSMLGQNRKKSMLNDINSQIIKLNTSSQTLRGGKYTKAAIAYKQAMDSTIFGLSNNSTTIDVMRAIPKGDKDYFMSFMKEKDEKKRKKILKIVSPYEKKALQIAWGEKHVDKIKSNEKYFGNHYMPSIFWAGWRPQMDLQNTKIKTIENEGMLLSDFGIYESQSKEPDAVLAPEVGKYNESNSSALDLQAKIHGALSGTGLIGVKVSVSPSLSTNGIDIISNITNSARITQYRVKQAMNKATGTRMFY